MTDEDAADHLRVAMRNWTELLTLFCRKNGRVDEGEAQAFNGRWEILVKRLGEKYQYVNWR